MRYDCEFIFIHPVNVTTYQLAEVYKVKNKTMIYDYGIWDYYKGLNLVDISLVKRRIDLNDSVLTIEFYNGDVSAS